MALNIIACVKETFDIDHIKIESRTLEPILSGIPRELEDLSKNAIETAVRLKEKYEGKVTALTLARPETIRKSMKEALAMGADEAIIVTHDVDGMNPASTALALSQAIKSSGGFDLIVMGEGSADNYSGQVGPRVAQILGLPLLSYTCKVELEGDKLLCTSDLEESYEIYETPLPALVTVTNEINEPRLPSLTHILRASKKPMKEIAFSSMGIAEDSFARVLASTKIVSNKAPKLERKRLKFEGELEEVVPELVSALSKDGYVGR